MSWRLWIAFSLLVPVAGQACDSGDRQRCKEELRELVSYRTEAIERAFGDLLAVMPETIGIKFVGPTDAEYQQYSRKVAYDISQEMLVIPRYLLSARIPRPLRASGSYWPFYQNQLYRQTFPIISAVDNAIWGAYLQEAAQLRGLSWPHVNCGSVDLAERLPCEMLVEGIAEHLTAARSPLFNPNRLDRFWPQDFAAFSERVWRKEDPRYIEVQRFGGWMLIKPLFDEFGIPRVLVYIAQTPFVVEQNDLESSALRYQIKARESLGEEDSRKLQAAESPSAHVMGAGD